MRKHHSLGSAGAAAGVEELGNVIFVEGKNVGARDAVRRQQVLQEQVCLRDGLVNGDVALDGGAGLAQCLNQWGKFAFEHQHASACVIENGNEFGGLQAHVERHGNGPNQGRSVIAFQQLMIVEAEIGDPVTRASALGKKAGSQAFAAFSELSVGE